MHDAESVVNEKRARLVGFLRRLPEHIREHLENCKREGKIQRQRVDWLWYALVTSFSTMGNSRGYAALVADPENLKSLTFESLAKLEPIARRDSIEKSMRRAKVRMPGRKAEWLARNFVKVQRMGGVAKANQLAFAARGLDGKIAFLQQFDGVGEKYSRNIWMDIYDIDFHDSIAIDQRIKNVSSALGVKFKNYHDHEKFYRDIATEVDLQPWELDRVMYWFLSAVLDEIAGRSVKITPTETIDRPVLLKNSNSAESIIQYLQLVPLTIEGGYFRETYRSILNIPPNALPQEYDGRRNASTAIYYLLTPETFSAIHRVKSDEVFHFYAGDPVEMLQLFADGTGRVVTISNDLAAGHEPQLVVPAGVWQGCRLATGGKWALMGCTVAPGFDYADFELATRHELRTQYSEYSVLIDALTAKSP